MKICKTCGRRQHKGLCDMATLEDGRIVHASRIDSDDSVEGVRVKNRWIKSSKPTEVIADQGYHRITTVGKDDRYVDGERIS